ncbi:hypothetical protein TEQG_08020 [Trichophyton equinum CBS 127.97]|uniref:Uncharacterized protein n=1 Tax=Trichophyton equinum (strain ATCC MYA-4606 / CBS 127.97) TaxID=559882 RepID=F2Q4Y7_TRIEC|nr:hypothetical protein TEQG_08020 [Trichophyton equinum CBS 127.97]
MVSWLAALHPHGWLRGILDNYMWKRKADLAGKTNPGSRQLSGWVKTREAILLTTRAAMLWTSISCQAWRTRSYPHRRLWGEDVVQNEKVGKRQSSAPASREESTPAGAELMVSKEASATFGARPVISTRDVTSHVLATYFLTILFKLETPTMMNAGSGSWEG